MKEELLTGTFMYRDKIKSFMNRTKVRYTELPYYICEVMEGLNLDKEDALRKMINWAIDKKIKVSPIRVRCNGVEINKIENITELVQEAKNV